MFVLCDFGIQQLRLSPQLSAKRPAVKALDSDRSGSVTYAELKRACHKAGAGKDS